MSNITLSYSPSDFFYLNAKSDLPDQSWCDKAKAKPLDCVNFKDATKEMCYQQELCSNKEMAEYLESKTNHHKESVAKMNDIYSQYMNEYAKTINLSVGMLLSVAFIYYNY
jgi:hypothetical protein